MAKKELKQKFNKLYEKRKNFYERHIRMAEKIGFEYWQKNEMFQYYKKGATEETKELQEEINELKNIKDVADLLRLNNNTVITMCQLNNRFVSAENKLVKAKDIIRKLLEDIEIAENEYKFTSQTAIKAKKFLKG